jgi:2-C-methyl-D-erythritol 2,4-cyclodiphosphate synthase
VAEAPKLASYREEMCQNLAACLHLEIDQVNVKYTTTEGLGFSGRKEGIAAYALCSVKEVLGK